MNGTLLGVGIACIIGAIVGGGLRAFGIEIPALSSLRRQILLAVVGALLVVVSIFQSSRPAQPSERERRLIMEVCSRAQAALDRLGGDERDINSTTNLYPPEAIYYNVTRFLNNSFPGVANPPDNSAFSDNKELTFEAVIRELTAIKGKARPLESAWGGFRKIDNLSNQKTAQPDKRSSLEAVANARAIITNDILNKYFRSTTECTR